MKKPGVETKSMTLELPLGDWRRLRRIQEMRRRISLSALICEAVHLYRFLEERSEIAKIDLTGGGND
jgi:hypothetical protein